MDGFAPAFSSRSYEDDEEDDNLCDHIDASSLDGFATSGERGLADNKRHRGHYDSDRRNRREIANSNERKRMQSINAGFQSLRSIVCPKMGEKLSKAAILKYAAEFINSLMRDKQQLIIDKRRLELMLTGGTEPGGGGRRCLGSSNSISSSRLSPTPYPPASRKRWRDTESSSSDEGIGFASTDEVVVSSSSSRISELQRQVTDLKQLLEKERTLRLSVEMDRERLELLQQQQPPQPQPSLSYQRKLSTSSSSSSSSSASDTMSLDLAILLPTEAPTKTPSSSSSSKDPLHSHMWRRNLETIVEAIRHVEGESGLFASPVPTEPEPHSTVAQSEPDKPTPTEAVHVAAPSTELKAHPHPVWLHDLASPSFLSSSPDVVGFLRPFHRPSLAVPSS